MNVRQRFLGMVLLSGSGAWAASAAYAVTVTGSFAGISINVVGYDHLPNGGNGSPLSGTFSFETDAYQWPDGGGLATGLNLRGTLNELGGSRVWGFENDVGIFNVEETLEGQVLSLASEIPRYWVHLTLAGAPGAFVDGSNLQTFRAAPVDASRSSLTFPRSPWALRHSDIQLTEVTINPLPAAPIPEPEIWLGMLVGLGALLARSRHARASKGAHSPIDMAHPGVLS